MLIRYRVRHMNVKTDRRTYSQTQTDDHKQQIDIIRQPDSRAEISWGIVFNDCLDTQVAVIWYRLIYKTVTASKPDDLQKIGKCMALLEM